MLSIQNIFISKRNDIQIDWYLVTGPSQNVNFALQIQDPQKIINYGARLTKKRSVSFMNFYYDFATSCIYTKVNLSNYTNEQEVFNEKMMKKKNSYTPTNI